jgi:hypothetical protein
MGSLDRFIFIFFISISLLGLTLFVFSLRRALRAANEKDEGLRMFLWTVGALIGIILVGVSAIYFLIPIIIFHYGQ